MMGNFKLYAMAALLAAASAGTNAQDTRQMEKLSRGGRGRTRQVG